MKDIGTVSCELCGEETHLTSIRRCDRCYELEQRIWDDPDIARRILADLHVHVEMRPVKLEVVR